MEDIPLFQDYLTEKEATMLNPLVLAYVGDAVHTLFVRAHLASSSDAKTGELHKLATAEVKATHQSELAGELLPLLTEEELAIYKRARNSKMNSTAKHAELVDYRRATGYEAVLGFLYLTGQLDRLKSLLGVKK